MIFTSVTRISDLAECPFDVGPLPRDRWATGDYVLAEVTADATCGTPTLELQNGREIKPLLNDLVVGVLGVRHATLEAVGSWEDVGDDGVMSAMTAAGLFGRVTSKSILLPRLISIEYRGHAMRGERKVIMDDFMSDEPVAEYDVPTVLIVGTSMSAGKTTTARVVIRLLKRLGLRVAGAKLTGAARFRDGLSMLDAGADAIFDFVDVGLPSSVCPAETFRPRLRRLLSMIAGTRPDVAVVEAGASPLEPYNGDTVVEALAAHVRCTILCASDPYAVVGVSQGFRLRPSLVAGLATATSAGIALVDKLAGVPALNILDPDCRDELSDLLRRELGDAIPPAE